MTVLSAAINWGSFNRVVTGPTAWFGAAAATVGVSCYDAAGTAYIRGTTKAAPTVAAVPLNITATALTLASTTGGLNITADTSMLVTPGTSFAILSIGRAFNAFSVAATQTILRYNTAVSQSAIIVEATGIEVLYQDDGGYALRVQNTGTNIFAPTGFVGLEANATVNKINYNGSTTLTAFAATDDTITLYNTVTNPRLTLSTWLAFPNIPASSQGSGCVYRDASGFLKID